jgi:hypothetical protein
MERSDIRASDLGGLRISDADRDQISEVLSEHASEGRLTMDELDQRLGTLYASQTRAQAASVVADLPPLAAAHPGHRFHLGFGHHDAVPTLPEWLTAGEVFDSTPPTAVTAPDASRPATGAPARGDRAALRKQAKLRADENAIGHAFQAKRRAINAELEQTAAMSEPADVQRLKQALREAQETMAAARQAAAVGDRAEVQRLLARLRTPA